MPAFLNIRATVAGIICCVAATLPCPAFAETNSVTPAPPQADAVTQQTIELGYALVLLPPRREAASTAPSRRLFGRTQDTPAKSQATPANTTATNSLDRLSADLRREGGVICARGVIRIPGNGSVATASSMMITLQSVSPGGAPGDISSLHYGVMLRARARSPGADSQTVSVECEISHPVPIGRGFDLKRHAATIETTLRDRETLVWTDVGPLIESAASQGGSYLEQVPSLSSMFFGGGLRADQAPALLLGPAPAGSAATTNAPPS